MKHRVAAFSLVVVVAGGCDGKSSPTPAPSQSGTITVAASAASSAAPAPKAVVVKAAPSNVPATLEGTSMKVGSMTADGLSVANLACAGSGGMMMTFTLGGLVSQKDAILACNKGNEKRPRVHWTMDAGRTTDVRVADTSSPEAARCLADAIAKVKTNSKATCIATLVFAKEP